MSSATHTIIITKMNRPCPKVMSLRQFALEFIILLLLHLINYKTNVEKI